MNVRGALFVAFSLIAAACGAAADAGPGVPPEADDRPAIAVPLTLYRLIDSGGSGLGTSRTVEEISDIGQQVAGIWGQAEIRLDPLHVRDIDVPSALLEPIAAEGDIRAFAEALGSSLEVQDPGTINGFFLSEAFGVNGFAPAGTRLFFVVDEPTVPDRRVTSHEIGHIFGLHHDGSDSSRLMFSGTDGETLTTMEQMVARYNAQGILDGQR